MEIKKLKKYLEENNHPEFRLKQILKAIYSDGVSSFSEISTLPKDLRESLDKEISVLSFSVEKTESEGEENSKKALLKLKDSNLIETVLMPGVKENHWTVCISSQVGCAMGCAFCATGQLGFKRNLSFEEIVDQVLFWKQYLKKERPEDTLANIVFMGMGEPFMNYEEISKAINKILDENLFNFSARHISVSTSGIAEKIRKFSKDFPQLNLAISLIFPTDELRDKYMPVNKRSGLQELKESINYYLDSTSRKVFLEYILFESLNDNEESAKHLANFISSIDKKHLIHVNLISFNQTDTEFKSTSREQAKEFQKYLKAYNIYSTLRKSLGQKINAACGQLAAKK